MPRSSSNSDFGNGGYEAFGRYSTVTKQFDPWFEGKVSMNDPLILGEIARICPGRIDPCARGPLFVVGTGETADGEPLITVGDIIHSIEAFYPDAQVELERIRFEHNDEFITLYANPL